MVVAERAATTVDFTNCLWNELLTVAKSIEDALRLKYAAPLDVSEHA
jgi:hypothetical protein